MTPTRQPIIVIGAGGAGTRMAQDAASRLGAEYFVVSNDAGDLPSAGTAVHLDVGGVLNPTIHLIRSSAYAAEVRIRELVGPFGTVVVITGLAGRSGAGVAPAIAEICAQAGKKVVSFAIMPFRYEKGMIFNSGIALRRLRESSECTVIVDNDAILAGNPRLSTRSCYEIANSAVMHVVGSLGSSGVPEGTSVLSSGRGGTAEALRGAIKALYEDVPGDSVAESMIHVLDGETRVGDINAVSEIADGVFRRGTSEAGVSGSGEGIVMLSKLSGNARFDAYDALGAIPDASTLDWEIPERALDCELGIGQIERQ